MEPGNDSPRSAHSALMSQLVILLPRAFSVRYDGWLRACELFRIIFSFIPTHHITRMVFWEWLLSEHRTVWCGWLPSTLEGLPSTPVVLVQHASGQYGHRPKAVLDEEVNLERNHS